MRKITLLPINNPLALSMLLLVILLAASACQKKRLEDLRYDGGKYTDQGAPFSGRVYSFSGGTGGTENVSAFYNFGDGIPRGYWISYGPGGVITQYGRFRPYTDTALLHKFDARLKRINIYAYKQGPSLFSDIFLILPKNGSGKTGAGNSDSTALSGTDDAFANSMRDKLLEKHMVDTSYGRTIHKIIVSDAELHPEQTAGGAPMP